MDARDESKTDRTVYLGTKLSVQVVSMKGENERCVKVMAAIDDLLKAGAAKSKL